MTAIDSPYLTPDISDRFPDAITQQFWDRCTQHVLAFQKCSNCGTFRNPPVPFCYVCRSTDSQWAPVSGDGTIYSFTIVTHAVHPGLVEKIPFNVALVEFPDAPGVRLISNVIDATPDEMRIGLPVTLHWEDLGDDTTLPRFKKG
jgi:uncharacterized OB-fold protein